MVWSNTPPKEKKEGDEIEEGKHYSADESLAVVIAPGEAISASPIEGPVKG